MAPQVTFAGYAMATLLWIALIAFAVLGGADLGAGAWDVIARGERADRIRKATIEAIGPIWEANAIWIVYFITGLWTVFPSVFAALTTALFIPLTAALLGIVMRGASYAYYSRLRAAAPITGEASPWVSVLAGASLLSAFLLGAALAATASGAIRVRNGQVSAGYWTTWTTPFALICGAFAVGICAVLSATYLAVERRDDHDAELAETFRRRALVSGGVTALIGLVAILLARAEVPELFGGLFGRALPLTLGAMALGLATAAALLAGRLRLARVLVAGMVTLILAAWAIAQWPRLIPPDVTLQNAVAAPDMQWAVFIASLFGLPIVLGSLWFLFYVFKTRRREPQVSAEAFYESLQPTPDDEAAGGSPQRPPAANAPALTPPHHGGTGAKQDAGGARHPSAARLAGAELAQALAALALPALYAVLQRRRDEARARRRVGRG